MWYADASTGGCAMGPPGTASALVALTLLVESPYRPDMRLLRFGAATEQQRDRLGHRESLVAHPVNRVGQRHLDVVAGRERKHRLARRDAFCDVPAACQLRRLHRLPTTEPGAEGA